MVHLIDVSPYTQRDPIQDYRTALKELEAFNPKLIHRRQILVANKIDLLDKNKDRLEAVKALAQKEGLPFLAISALRKKGLKELVALMAESLDSLQEKKS